MDYIAHTLPNGLRMVHLPVNSPVSYCGFAVNAGTRDENEDEFGLAHFVEHMIFKGTEKRSGFPFPIPQTGDREGGRCHLG